MANKRIAKAIVSKEDIEYIRNIKEEDITTSFIMETFGSFNGKSRFNPYDTIVIPPDSYGPEGRKNKKPCHTTVGIYIYNKYFFENDLFDIIGYVNQEVNGNVFDDINNKLSYALIEDKITLDQMKLYLKKTQKVMPYCNILSPGYTEKMLTCTSVINKKKEELLKKYKDKIDQGDAETCSQIEKELLDYAAEYLKDDPSMDMFLSKARGSYDNNFKNMFVMKGAVRDPDPNAKKKYNIITSNYIDGVSKEEYAALCNSLAAGPYSRSNKTSFGGYIENLVLVAYEHVVLAPEGSDCGTKDYITVNLSGRNLSAYMYNYIIEGSRLIELNSENMDKYKGKTVKMRFSSMCEYNKKDGCLCSKCAGSLFYKTGRMNIGNSESMVPSTLKNVAMKNFHDSQERFVEMDPMKAFGLK